MRKTNNFLILLAISIIPTLAIWAPFFLRLKEVWNIPIPQNGMATIMANFDGPLYIVIAKTFYNLPAIGESFSFPLPLQYYAAHFPLYPILIAFFGTVLNLLFGNTFGFPWGMLIVTVLSSFLSIYYFSKFISKYVNKKHVIWITLVFALLPARWLIVKSVGSPEPLFMGSVLASIYYFDKKKYWSAGAWGALAQLTKSPGILLFVAFGLALIIPRINEIGSKSTYKWIKGLEWKAYPILLIPVTLLGLFIFYGVRFGDFFAYFNSGDNIHLQFPPFQIFNYSQPWVGTFWLEEIILVYLLGGLGVVKLFKQNRGTMAWFSLVFFTSIIFVSHRDVIRYSLPILPFLYVAYSETVISREFKYVMGLLIIPIYLFSIAYISNNVMPISDWSPFL